jgi:preprotein translocase subunit SecB
MADEQNQDPVMQPEAAAEGQAAGQPAAQAAGGAQFQIQKIYTKDVSFELPNAPQVFQQEGQADVKMSLAQRVESLGENLHEVVLTVTVTATVGDKTAYLAEVAQAGIFLVSGFNEQTTHAVMNTMCPGTLFPYARQTISGLIADGGFPPLVLQPVNFEQLYAQRMQQMVNEQQQSAAGAAGEQTVVRGVQAPRPERPMSAENSTGTDGRPAVVAVLGAGSWGTALAMQLARAGSKPVLWDWDSAHMEAMRLAGRNEKFMPGHPLPERLVLEPDLETAVRAADEILIVVPSHAFVGVDPADRTVAQAGAGGRLGLQGPGAGHRPVPARAGPAPVRRQPPAGGGHRAFLRRRSRRGPAHRGDRGRHRPRVLRPHRPLAACREFPRLHQRRHHRRRTRRFPEKRAGGRHGHLRRDGAWATTPGPR